MQIDFTKLNFLAILIAVVVNQGVGALWYSPVLFGSSWADLVGIKSEDIDKKAAMRGFVFALIFAMVVYLLIALIVSAFNNPNWLVGVIIGFIISVIVIFQMATNYVYENRSIKLYLINAFYPVICYTAGGAIIGAF